MVHGEKFRRLKKKINENAHKLNSRIFFWKYLPEHKSHFSRTEKVSFFQHLSSGVSLAFKSGCQSWMSSSIVCKCFDSKIMMIMDKLKKRRKNREIDFKLNAYYFIHQRSKIKLPWNTCCKIVKLSNLTKFALLKEAKPYFSKNLNVIGLSEPTLLLLLLPLKLVDGWKLYLGK